MIKEVLFEIKSACQNFRLIDAIYCNNMENNRQKFPEHCVITKLHGACLTAGFEPERKKISLVLLL